MPGFSHQPLTKTHGCWVNSRSCAVFGCFGLWENLSINTPWWSCEKIPSSSSCSFKNEKWINIISSMNHRKVINNQSLQRLVARRWLNRPSEKYARPPGSFQQVGMKIWNTWNHHLAEDWWGLIRFEENIPEVPRVPPGWKMIAFFRFCCGAWSRGTLLFAPNSPDLCFNNKKTGESSRFELPCSHLEIDWKIHENPKTMTKQKCQNLVPNFPFIVLSWTNPSKQQRWNGKDISFGPSHTKSYRTFYG